MVKLWNILIRIVVVFLFLGGIFFQYYNPIPLYEDESFIANLEKIKNTDFSVKNNVEILIGKGRGNITPDITKKNKSFTGMIDNFQSIEDSLFVSCLLFKTPFGKTALISFDLILLTPNLSSTLKSKLKEMGINQVIFSASHTHSSFGGFGTDLISEIALGNFDEDVFNRLIEKSLIAVKKAQENLTSLEKMVFKEKIIDKCVNRLTKEEFVKEGVRQVEFLTSEKKIILSSMNIHPTYLWGEKVISKDYTRIFTKDNDKEFGMFVAGTMGSIKPMSFNKDTTQITIFKSVLNKSELIYNDTLESPNTFNFSTIPLQLPKLRPLVSKQIAASSIVSNILFSEVKASINVLRINDFLMISLPCELSAEFYPEFKSLASKKGLYLMVTSFNGSYLGYATPSKHFSIDYMETRTMNWSGKFGGDYFSSLVKEIIEKQ